MKKIFKFLLGIFLLFQVVIFFHAYQFTHFTDKPVQRTNEHVSGFFEKMKLAFFGVNNPRPVNTIVPGRPYETVYIQSYVELEAWKMSADSSKGTVIIFHGYAGKKSDMLDRAEIFNDHGYDILLVDFKGSGGSQGNSTSLGHGEAVEVKDCYDHIANTGEKNIYLFGTSMGAAAILKTLHDHDLQPAAVFLECPFGSMYKTVCARFKLMNYPSFPMAGLLMFWGSAQNGFWAFSHNPAAYAKNVKCPVLLMYGEKDNRVSREETDAIYNNLGGKKQLLTFPDTGHENYLVKNKERWETGVFRFISEL